ncbi:MAG: hypothetical protein ONB44_20710 [candidate division KSB1 bacterium]|nr:hypothetical protein [candidate division KSB1 bacterium]MDZ7304554.1 hypothetical protein [candidate division KSB1 bacterium]MDZ7313723.1 hypothetical protein [candidate division KSB1 bacterium]
MDASKISTILALGTSFIMFGVGLAVLVGWVFPPTVPNAMRITFGVVFILMGIYRFVATRMQARQREEEDE